MTPDHAGNVVGIDPHKRALTVTIIDPRGGIVASEHLRVSGEGHRELEVWAQQFGQIARWGVEGSASWGRHTAMFLVGRGCDVREVCANRTPRSDRARQRGKACTTHAALASRLYVGDVVISLNCDCVIDDALRRNAGFRFDPDRGGCLTG